MALLILHNKHNNKTTIRYNNKKTTRHNKTRNDNVDDNELLSLLVTHTDIYKPNLKKFQDKTHKYDNWMRKLE
eukprot:6217795-Ditylum_brightwellii.AAC.1